MSHPAPLPSQRKRSATDQRFLAGFENCSFPFSSWSHRAHVRMAFLYLSTHEFDEALGKIRRGIQAYNAANNVPDGPQQGYHETLTVHWSRLIAHAIEAGPPTGDSQEFCDRHPEFFEKSALLSYYSRDRLMSIEAKQAYVEPDLAPLPQQSRS